MFNSRIASLFSKVLFQKCLFLSVVALFISCILYAQQEPTGKFQQTIDSMVRINQLHNRSLQHGTFSFNQSATRNKSPRVSINIPSLNRPLGVGNCVDTSSKISIGKDSSHFYVGISVKTKDGNLLISGEYYNYWEQVSSSKGFLMKCDLYGNVIWAKLYDSTNHQSYHYLVNYYVTELMDGSILMAGMAPDYASINDDMILTRTDANGNIIWVKDYYSRAWTHGNGSADYFDIRHITQDPSSGDVYISSSAWAEGVYVIKVSISDGSIPWSNMYRLYTNGYGFQTAGGVVIRSNDLVAFGTTSPYNTMIMMYRINKATGDTFNTKILQLTDTPYYKKGFANLQSIQQLTNGNIALAGTLYGYYQYMYNGIDPLYQAGVVEVDQNLNFVKGYVLRNNFESNFYNSRITLHPDGSGLLHMLKVTSGYSGEQYIIQLKDGVILKERRRSLSNEGYPYEHPALQLSNGGEMLINLVGDSLANNSRVVFTKLHLSDTSSDCLGPQIFNTIVEPINYGNPIPGYMDSTRHFVMQERHVRTITATLYEVAAPKPACYQIANCDTLILKATADTICPQVPFFITASKKRACGSQVQFSYDTSAVQSFTPVNDSVYQVVFKRAWKGTIKGSLAGCKLYTDSVPVTVLLAPPLLSLGPDTVLCPGNQIILNALSGYASYRWQNGSTDSLFTVTQPGTYTVEVLNACGDRFTDTLIVAQHPPIPFYIGLDTSICQNQFVTLNAPAGFINYQWLPAYNINQTTGNTIKVNPAIDTAYSVKAEKTPGCFVYDTIKVYVKTLLPIALGADKSFCSGDNVVLNAGTGFAQYQWSNGSTTQQIFVSTKGNYSVTGITADGCKSYDTLSIVNVWANPIVNLDHNPNLCTGSTRTLQAGNYSSYNWQDGSILPSFTINALGNYHVTVTDNHQCQGSDTVHILTLLTLPAKFLPADTALCSYDEIAVKSSQVFSSYLWSTGETGAVITIKQAGTYWLQATDQYACTGKDSVTVLPKECMKGLYVPTAFSPNQDGKNDVFKPLIFGNILHFEWTIYNRYGQAVFTTHNTAEGWDGTVKGILQNPAGFIWQCRYQLEGEKMKFKSGAVVLVR